MTVQCLSNTQKEYISATETNSFTLSTHAFASLNMVKAQSVRARVSRFGSYYGVRPRKLINGRTAWPEIQVRDAIVPNHP